MSGQTLIVDGLTSKSASVDNNNRLETKSTTQSNAVDSSLKGDAFFISTSTVNLTSDNLSYILYIKNNENFNWVLKLSSMDFGVSDGVGDKFFDLPVNPVEGTLISDGFDGRATNLNLGSAKQLDAIIKIGGEGSTIIVNDPVPLAFVPDKIQHAILDIEPVIVAPGTSFAVGIKPPVGNTSMNVATQVALYREEINNAN